MLGVHRIDALMQVAPGWDELPAVLDGASELLLAALGERGQHARSLCGVERLPRNAPVALSATVAVRAGAT